MKQKTILKPFLLAASLSLGLVSAAATRADDSGFTTQSPADAAVAAGNLSLLGQAYGTLAYSYINLDDTSAHADRYGFEMNNPLSHGLDGVFAYDYTRSSSIAGSHVSQHALTLALRAFSSSFNWGKPYVEAGVGHAWHRFAGASENAFRWEAGAGIEFQVTSRATVTPYVRYMDMPELANEGTWNAGVKGSYWIDSSWAVTAGFARDDEQNSAFTVGTNFRF